MHIMTIAHRTAAETPAATEVNELDGGWAAEVVIGDQSVFISEGQTEEDEGMWVWSTYEDGELVSTNAADDIDSTLNQLADWAIQAGS